MKNDLRSEILLALAISRRIDRIKAILALAKVHGMTAVRNEMVTIPA